MHVEGVVVEDEKVCVTSLLPTFPLTQVPLQERDGTRPELHYTEYSIFRSKKKFPSVSRV